VDRKEDNQKAGYDDQRLASSAYTQQTDLFHVKITNNDSSKIQKSTTQAGQKVRIFDQKCGSPEQAGILLGG
jgi:hypothetical protein